MSGRFIRWLAVGAPERAGDWREVLRSPDGPATTRTLLPKPTTPRSSRSGRSVVAVSSSTAPFLSSPSPTPPIVHPHSRSPPHPPSTNTTPSFFQDPPVSSWASFAPPSIGRSRWRAPPRRHLNRHPPAARWPATACPSVTRPTRSPPRRSASPRRRAQKLRAASSSPPQRGCGGGRPSVRPTAACGRFEARPLERKGGDGRDVCSSYHPLRAAGWWRPTRRGSTEHDGAARRRGCGYGVAQEDVSGAHWGWWSDSHLPRRACLGLRTLRCSLLAILSYVVVLWLLCTSCAVLFFVARFLVDVVLPMEACASLRCCVAGSIGPLVDPPRLANAVTGPCIAVSVPWPRILVASTSGSSSLGSQLAVTVLVALVIQPSWVCCARVADWNWAYGRQSLGAATAPTAVSLAVDSWLTLYYRPSSTAWYDGPAHASRATTSCSVTVQCLSTACEAHCMLVQPAFYTRNRAIMWIARTERALTTLSQKMNQQGR